MVPLTVTVTDRNGHYITDLTVEDFRIFEDGVHQSVAFFASDEIPVDLGVLLDTSGSMTPHLPILRAAAGELVNHLARADRGALLLISRTASIAQPFTADLTKLTDAISRISISGSTALYDSLYIVLREFERERRTSVGIRRQALVLVSDGVDNQSRLSAEDVVDLTRRAGVNIYVIALHPDGSTRRTGAKGAAAGEYAMSTIARESGGALYIPKTAGELPAICSAIMQELASQYQLGYVPVRSRVEGGFRRVTVQVGSRTDVRARTRSGYYAMRSTRAGR